VARPDAAARRQAERAGRRGEALAAAYLRLKGYRVLARNVRTPFGEIDMVLRRGKTVIFAEVKRRGRETEAGMALGWRQRERITRAGRYLAESGRYAEGTDGYRFDLLVLNRGRWPVHLADAWRP
jgi:putative endonuclease